MARSNSGYTPAQHSLERRDKRNARLSLFTGKVLPLLAYPVLLIGCLKGLNLSGMPILARITFPLAQCIFNKSPRLWKYVPYPDINLPQDQPLALAVSYMSWFFCFIGVVLICKGLVKRSQTLYARSDERRRNIGIYEAVSHAMQVHGNLVNVSGIDNAVSATNTTNNNYQSPDNDWKLKTGIWLAVTGGLGTLFGEFLLNLLEKLFGG